MQKKRLSTTIFFIALGILVFLGCFVIVFIIANCKSTDTIEVMTKDDTTNVISYYEVRSVLKSKKINVFTPDKMEEFTVENCYESYREDNELMNRPNFDTCIIKDKAFQSVNITQDFRNIIEQVSKNQHDIFQNKIFIMNEEYYVVVKLNVNLWTPYELYYYDTEKVKLKLLYTFDGKDVIGLKLNKSK